MANTTPELIQGVIDPQLRAALLRMSRHVAWMFWLWIGIPLILAGLVIVLIGLSVGGGVS